MGENFPPAPDIVGGPDPGALARLPGGPAKGSCPVARVR